MGGKTVFSTGGIGYDCTIAMTLDSKCFFLVVVTAAAILALRTGFSTGGSISFDPVTHIVTQFVHRGVSVEITAVGAGMGGKAVLGTGGIGYNCFVVVARGFLSHDLVALVTAGTNIVGIAFGGAGVFHIFILPMVNEIRITIVDKFRLGYKAAQCCPLLGDAAVVDILQANA